MSPPATGAHHPWMPARRPGCQPSFTPRYFVLVHHRLDAIWGSLPQRVGIESAQQFWDHVALDPGRPPRVNSTTMLRGKRGTPLAAGFSRTIHYEISGAGRIDFQFNPDWSRGASGDAHAIVVILRIDLGSH